MGMIDLSLNVKSKYSWISRTRTQVQLSKQKVLRKVEGLDKLGYAVCLPLEKVWRD
jgi:hypothetical protein